VLQLGDDYYGKEYLKAFIENKVDTSFVQLTEGQHSGIAQITVADSGIIISSRTPALRTLIKFAASR
jgi:sugar/nucleoside kinase (ribokinase family)